METESDVRIILQDLPTSVKGFVFIDSTYSPCIVLNSRMPEEIRRKTFRHEMEHIRHDDMTNRDYKEYGNDRP